MIFPTRHITVSIHCSFEKVYGFISNPENLPKWAAGLSRSALQKSGDDWIADSPMGQVKVRFVPNNPYGIVDHDVTLPSGEVNHNPLRVIRNGKGSNVVFTLFKLDGVSEEAFARDAAIIEKDLLTLKSILEASEK